jgi:hypothetical protein
MPLCCVADILGFPLAANLAGPASTGMLAAASSSFQRCRLPRLGTPLDDTPPTPVHSPPHPATATGEEMETVR